MAFDADYHCDTEFSKLLTRRTDVDLTVAALELARDAYPDLDFSETLCWIEETGDRLCSALSKAGSDKSALEILSNCIAGQHGITGDSETYSDADNSYLHRVIQRKRGIPISLSLLYMAVAAQAGITLEGVAAPAHFLTRFEAVEGPVFLDAFCGGCVRSYEETLQRVRNATGLSSAKSESLLEPASPRAIVIRMLHNLKTIHAQAENWSAAWMVQHRLVLLLPGSYDERRDLGVVALRSDRPGQAIDLLQNCLKTCPPEETQPLTTFLEEAQRQVMRWN